MEIVANYSSYINDKVFNFYIVGGAKFNIPIDVLDDFYTYCSKVINDSPDIHMLEYSKAEKGIWIDIDAYSKENKTVLNKHYASLCKLLVKCINATIDNEHEYIDVHILNKDIRQVDNGLFKHSAHLRVTSIRVCSKHAEDIINDFRNESRDLFSDAFGEDCDPVDTKVVNVHPLFYGCNKPEGKSKPHKYHMTMRVEEDNAYPIDLPDDIILGRELSLCFRSRAEIITEEESGYVHEPDDYDGDIIAMQNNYGQDCVFMYKVLTALDGDYKVFDKWSKMLFMISNSCTNIEVYKLLAKTFTKKHIDADTRKVFIVRYYKSSIPMELDEMQLIDKIILDKWLCKGFKSIVNFGYISNLLRIQDKDLYNKLVEDSIEYKLVECLYSGRTEILDIIPILTIAFSRFRAVDMNGCDCWYEYVDEYEYTVNRGHYDKGDCCKYKLHSKSEPSTMTLLIADIQSRLSSKITNMKQWHDQQSDNSNTKKIIKLLRNRLSILSKNLLSRSLYKNLRNHLYYNDLIHILDSNPNVMGVMNGVIELGETIKFHTLCQDLYVTRRANARYIEYDPNNPYIKRMEQIFRRIYREDEALYEFMMKIYASALDGHLHELFIILRSKGNSGKSTIMNLLLCTLGITNKSGYLYNMPSGYLSLDKNTSGGDAPSVTLMGAHGARLLFQNELDAHKSIDDVKLKNIWDNPIGRNLYDREHKQCKITGVIIAHTNNEPKANTYDPGYWRRTIYIDMSGSFTETDIDTTIKSLCEDNYNEDSQNYRDALLAILIKYYAKYYEEVVKTKKSVKRMMPISVKYSTTLCRLRLDPVYRFTKEKFTKQIGSILMMDDIVGAFVKWCEEDRGRANGNIDGASTALIDHLKETYSYDICDDKIRIKDIAFIGR